MRPGAEGMRPGPPTVSELSVEPRRAGWLGGSLNLDPHTRARARAPRARTHAHVRARARTRTHTAWPQVIVSEDVVASCLRIRL